MTREQSFEFYREVTSPEAPIFSFALKTESGDLFNDRYGYYSDGGTAESQRQGHPHDNDYAVKSTKYLGDTDYQYEFEGIADLNMDELDALMENLVQNDLSPNQCVVADLNDSVGVGYDNQATTFKPFG